MTEHSDFDQVSGKTTTGHEWDGIKELNTPLPRWWVITFYLCIIWAVVYWFLYPAWPLLSGNTTGFLGYSSRAGPRQRRGRRQGLPESERRRLAVGRHARPDHADHPVWRAFRSRRDASGPDARLRQGRHPEAGSDRDGRQLRPLVVGTVDPAGI